MFDYLGVFHFALEVWISSFRTSPWVKKISGDPQVEFPSPENGWVEDEVSDEVLVARRASVSGSPFFSFWIGNSNDVTLRTTSNRQGIHSGKKKKPAMF